MANREDLARIMTAEQGKPISEARGEIDYAASFVEFYAEETRRPNVEGVTSHLPDAEVELWREPVGVAALVTPWNFPCAMITRKAAAALAAGCTVLVHPSEQTPFSALALAELAERAGFPPGVINTVTGHAPEVVEPWLTDPRVAGALVHGLHRGGADALRPGRRDGEAHRARAGRACPVPRVRRCRSRSRRGRGREGQVRHHRQDCLGANRFLVAREIYEAFCTRFAEATARLTLGPGREDPDLGPLIDARAVRSRRRGGRALARRSALLYGGGGRPGAAFLPALGLLAARCWLARLFSEETFGRWLRSPFVTWGGPWRGPMLRIQG